MLIAYFSAIFMSIFILLSAEKDDNNQEEPICGDRVNDSCARLYGYILPVGFSAVFFTSAIVFFVFDVAFCLFNILTTAEDSLSRRKKESKSRLKNQQTEDDDGLSLTSLALLFVIDLGFIVITSALLWMSKTFTTDPLYIICERRLKLFWMLGLMVMVVVILLSAIKSFRDPLISNVLHIQMAAKTVSVIFGVLLLASALHYSITEPKEVGPCIRAPATDGTHTSVAKNPLQLYEGRQCEECHELFSLQDLYGLRSRDYGQCAWPRDRRRKRFPRCNCQPKPQCGRSESAACRETHRNFEWCEANYGQQCEWPRAKQIQPYERKDKCPASFPQCDWPWVKQIQAYERQDRCKAQDLPQCEWPWIKQILLYEHEEMCKAEDPLLCEWPWLKQVQLFQAKGQCPIKDPRQCEWGWVKQIQLYESKETCHLMGDMKPYQQCEWLKIENQKQPSDQTPEIPGVAVAP